MAPHGRQKGNALAVLDAIGRLAALAQCASCHNAMRNAKCKMRNAKCEMRNTKCKMQSTKCKMLELQLQISWTGGVVLQQQKGLCTEHLGFPYHTVACLWACKP